ncbi:MAG: hypothetical protein HY801_02630 [Candidatus Lindowbacteria bacterium]|nr:hypothetical protein [Candidatus Lindowbacteria bacterium]
MRSRWIVVSISLLCLLFVLVEAKGETIRLAAAGQPVEVIEVPEPTGGGAGAASTGGKKQLWVDPVNTFRPPSNEEKNAIAKNLQMTPEQTSQMQQIDQQYRADVQTLSQRYQQARKDLTTALKDPCPTSDRVSREAQKVSQTHAALLDKEIQHWTSISSVLTKDQACKFWKMFAQARIQKGN